MVEERDLGFEVLIGVVWKVLEVVEERDLGFEVLMGVV